MNRVILPEPPDARSAAYENPLAFNRAMSDWARRVKGTLEDTGRVNAAPMAQQFTIGAFSTNTMVQTGMTLAELVNFVASLAQAMQDKGLLTPVSSRTS